MRLKFLLTVGLSMSAFWYDDGNCFEDRRTTDGSFIVGDSYESFCAKELVE